MTENFSRTKNPKNSTRKKNMNKELKWTQKFQKDLSRIFAIDFSGSREKISLRTERYTSWTKIRNPDEFAKSGWFISC